MFDTSSLFLFPIFGTFLTNCEKAKTPQIFSIPFLPHSNNTWQPLQLQLLTWHINIDHVKEYVA
jgi:hypothetical protein